MSAPTSIDWSVIIQTAGFLGVIIAIVTGTHKITRYITKLEDRIEKIEENPWLQAFKKLKPNGQRVL